MRRWFLSYHSPDQPLAENLKLAIERKDSDSHVFFAPTHMQLGGSWSAQLAKEIADANAFVLLVGQHGVGNWQVLEYDEALERWTAAPSDFPLIVVLLEGQTAPGLPFLRRLHWVNPSQPSMWAASSACGADLLRNATSKYGRMAAVRWAKFGMTCTSSLRS